MPPPPQPPPPILPAPVGCSRFLCVQFSGAHVEELSGFIGVIDGQADGSDVLQRLYHKNPNTKRLRKMLQNKSRKKLN